MEEKLNRNNREDVYSLVVRAGKRTYFFDVKETRSGQKYLTITESKKRFSTENGKFYYEKHKIFLYKEDFEKFLNGLRGVIGFIETGQEPVVADIAEEISINVEDAEFEQLGETPVDEDEEE